MLSDLHPGLVVMSRNKKGHQVAKTLNPTKIQTINAIDANFETWCFGGKKIFFQLKS